MEITIQYITTTTSEMGNVLRFFKDGLKRNNYVIVRFEKDVSVKLKIHKFSREKKSHISNK